MTSRITVYQTYGDLQQEVFTFWLDEYTLCLKLDEYRFQIRASKRHKWQTVQWWNRSFSRDANIARDAITVSDEIRATALQEFLDKFTIEE